MSTPDIQLADLADAHARAEVVALVDAYARDPMGGGAALDEATRAGLERGLADEAAVRVLVARVEGAPVGVAFCQRTYSTFAAAPRLNLHDLAVLPEARGRGIGRALLEAVEALARELGCSAVTLEVYEHNERAQGIYLAAGFESMAPGHRTFFLTKEL